MAAKGRLERRRITYTEILEETGVSKNTLSRLANDKADMVGVSVINSLCAYFGCQPGDLFVYVADDHEGGEVE